MGRRLPLAKVLDLLEEQYGKPEPPSVTDPFDQILYENVIYLASDEKRDQAFALLKKNVGLRPEQILFASDEVLQAISSSAGILPELQVDKLQTSARIVVDEYQGDLNAALDVPLPQAKKVLRKFPAIGEPGAEKILLFSGKFALFPLESNGLRVLARLGFGEEKKNYGATYRSVREAVKNSLKDDFAWLVRAYLLLRKHGKELCKNNRPLCEECPLNTHCIYYRSTK